MIVDALKKTSKRLVIPRLPSETNVFRYPEEVKLSNILE